MDPNSPDALFQALRDSGLFPPEQLSALDYLPPELVAAPAALAEHLRALDFLNGYQAKKVRINRIVELLVGQYLILDKIGEGGMGKVYKAVQLRMGRPVALKIVRPHLLSNKTVMRRYEREAKAVSGLSHPNIVTLFDADESGGRYFLAMEFVNGSDLARLIKEFGPLHPAEAAEYVRQAALGLQHAHEQGVVHRDIKPSNLLVSGDRALPGTGGKAHVKILDMGLVRFLADDEDASRTELTRDGTVVGTPDYMAPEQAKNSSTVDGRADLYSLGGTLFYLLTGRPPYPDGSPIDKLLRHQLDPPPDLRKLRPGLPKELVAVVNALLAKRPEDRFRSAADLAARLAALGPNATVLTAEPVGRRGGRAVIPDGTTIVTVAVGDTRTPPGGAAAVRPVAVRPVAPPPDSTPALARPGTPVGIPRPPSAPQSSGSLPGYDADARRRPRRGRSSRRAKPRSLLPYVMIVGGAVALIAAAVYFAGHMSGSGAKSEPPAKVSPGKASDPPPSAVAARLGPVVANLPDSAAAALVVHPARYWERERAKYLVRPDSQFAGLLNALARNYRFDLRQCDRVTVGFPAGGAGRFVAVAEGGFLTPRWVEETKKVGLPTAADGLTLLKFARPGGPPVYAGLVDDDGYAVGSDEAVVVGVCKRVGKRGPSGVAHGVLDALPDPTTPTAPLAVFVADGQWPLPGSGGRTLTDYGVYLAVARVVLRDDALDVELTMHGDSQAALRAFVSRGLLNPKLIEVHPQLRMFVVPVTDQSSYEFEPIGNGWRLRTSGRWELADVHDWLEPLLPKLGE